MPSSPKAQNFKNALQNESEYLDAIINRLQKKHPQYADKIRAKLKDDQKHLGAWYELMVYDWLWKQGKNPIPEPTVSAGHPDYVFTSNNKKIYIEVASIQESKKDKELYESEKFSLSQKTATYAAMRERLIDKAHKYKSIADAGDAYVICLGLVSSLIDIEDVKTCFMTNDSYNLSTGEFQAALDGEIIERYDDGSFSVKYKNVSAILVARRNFTLNENENKLTFGLIQNPFAVNEIQPTEFGEILRFVVVAKTKHRYQMAWQR